MPRLDLLLGGGLLSGSLVLVIGAPGAGKTVLAQQLASHLADQGRPTLYLTGYSEPHEKLLAHAGSLRFFKPERIGHELQIANLLDLLRAGMEETQEAIVRAAASQHAALVVIDGFGGLRQLLPDEEAVTHFLYSLGAKLALLGATTLVLLEGEPDESARYPALSVCDVILALRSTADGERRSIQVMKARGMAPRLGQHPFQLTEVGLEVFPRFESIVAADDVSGVQERAGFGIPALDGMIGGGLNVGTVTVVAGTPGAGKTLLGLHFLAEGARLGEPTLFVGMMESLAQLVDQGRTFGLDLTAAQENGSCRHLMLPSYQLEADELAGLLAEDIAGRGVRRLVLDSATELDVTITDPVRKMRFLSALVMYLRSHQVTTYTTLDLPTLMGPELNLTGAPLSIIAENLLLLRAVEYRSQLHRICSVLKMRFSDYDRTISEYTITAGHGLQIVGPAPLGSGLLTGIASPLGDSGRDAARLGLLLDPPRDPAPDPSETR